MNKINQSNFKNKINTSPTTYIYIGNTFPQEHAVGKKKTCKMPVNTIERNMFWEYSLV